MKSGFARKVFLGDPANGHHTGVVRPVKELERSRMADFESDSVE